MKIPRLLFSFLLVLLILVLAPIASAQVSPVSMRIEQVNKTDKEKHKHVQKRSLKVHLTNASQQPREGLILRYYFFGKSIGDNDVILLEKGERSASVASNKTETVETPVVTKTYEDAHFEGDGKGKVGTKVKASGEKLVGYGVQLFEGEKMLTEQFSQPSYKELVGPRKLKQ